jgi:outer membrane protein OmpA-like peptidoglycan-associated protein
MRYNLTLTIAILVLSGAALHAQQTTIVNHFQGDTTGRGVGKFRLSGISEHRVVINYYEPAPDGEVERLSQLIGSALNFYIDQSAEVKGGKLRLLKSKKEMLRDMNEIVRNAVKYYDYREIAAFKGFSDAVAKRIDQLGELDFEKSEYAAQVTTPESRKQLEFFYFQKHLNDLKLQANIEVGNYGNENLLVFSSTESTMVDEATRDSLLKSMQSDPDAPLAPIFTERGYAELSLLGMEDNSTLTPAAVVASPPDDFSAKVIEMLERNNSKLDAMQAQIDQLREEQMKQWQQMQEARNDQMQAQINDLRNMVMDLIRMNTGNAITSSGNELVTGPSEGSGTVYNIPSAVNLYFQKGSSKLSPGEVLALNEVVDILARNPGLQLIITGYADKTGDPVSNLLLSQERAASVKRFLKSSGLSEDRFVTRYLGDSNSNAQSASDRKVVVEFIR